MATKAKAKPKAKTAKKKVTVAPHNWTNGGDVVLILKSLPANLKAHGGFQWPESGPVECPDFNESTECGGGLHGWPWGFGLGEGRAYDLIDDKWLIFSAKPEDVVGEVGNGQKCKARRGEVIYCGDFAGAMAKLVDGQSACIAEMAKSKSDSVSAKDDASLAASGYYSKLAASGNGSNLAASGYYSNLAASGYYSNLAASGNYSNLAASGNDSKLAASGNGSNLAASGYYSKLAASGNGSNLAASGYYSNLAASGNYSNLAASGNDSKLAASGYGSKLAASGNGSNLDCSGESSIALASYGSRVRVGPNGAFAIAWKDAKDIPHIAVGEVGKDGIEAGKWYEVRNGKIAEVR